MSEQRGKRRKAREAALSYLYQSDLDVGSVTKDPAKFLQHFSIDDESQDFFSKITEGVQEKKAEIDLHLEESAENWKLYRMEAIDRCILRLSTWELMSCPETDFQVVIDEAIELAKDFGSENSPSFVNGILDKLAQKFRKGL
ncbi:MAG: NusB antitermination factor [Bacteriovoracaceae bacterium]|nr:NusB antitermination factor [Bacteriovoracaceae bacterium]